MTTRIVVIATLLLCLGKYGFAQKKVNDKSVIYQQERMVFKQWDQNKFTPTHGFLYLNPLYWLTWAWFPNYHKTDLRPLGPSGPQTQRLALAAAMQNTDNAYKLQADTLRNTAISEAINYSGLVSSTDPLWLLYYSKEFKELLNQKDDQLLSGVSPKVQSYLVSSGIYASYLEQSHSLAERLNSTRTTTLDHGSRILTYSRLLAEYRKLNAAWATKKQQAGTFLALSEKAKNIKSPVTTTVTFPVGYKSDRQIADEILSHYKL
jgi:hypothetical protein